MSARLMTPAVLSFPTLSRRFVLILLALAALAAAGCRSNPIQDVGPSPIPAKATQQQVEQAIVRAGAGLGWAMKPQGPGLVIGTLAVRDHLAIVEIPHNSRSFSIRYKDSRNLDFNAAAHTIHKNYNSWVQNLNRAILAQLSML